MRPVLSTILLAAIAAGSAPATSGAAGHRAARPQAVAVRAGARRPVPAHFFGLNAESIVLPADERLLVNSVRLHDQLASLPVGILRIPGGTTSQWLDWRTGRFLTAADSPFAGVPSSRPPITMRRWASIVRATGATPLWDLNVLTSTLPDQLAMLRAAGRLGMPVRYIELGNELWDPRPPYPTVFPTGAAYGRAMTPWIRALRLRYPHALIAVSGADETVPSLLATVGGPRYRGWNAALLSTVRGENAIAIHPYWTLPGVATPGSSVRATLLAGPDHWDAFTRQTLGRLPARLPVWLTEYNQSSLLTSGGTQLWAQALSVSAVALDQLADARVTMSLLHDIVGGLANPQDHGTAEVFPLFTDGFGASRVLARTGLGDAIPMIYAAVARASAVARLRVRGAPAVGNRSGVSAIEVFGPRPGALLVNLTAQRAVVRLPPGLAGAATLASLRAPAGSQPGWVPADRVATRTRAVRGVVTLPPYSLDRLSLRTR